MIQLSEILDLRCIKLGMTASKKKEAIEELLGVLQKAEKLTNLDKDSLLRAFLTREKEISSGIGEGVAVPHKLVSGVLGTVIAVGRTNEGIRFDAIDGKPVRLFFLILGEAGNDSLHLRILSKLARLLHDSAFRDSLYNAKSPEDVIKTFTRWEDE